MIQKFIFVRGETYIDTGEVNMELSKGWVVKDVKPQIVEVGGNTSSEVRGGFLILLQKNK